MDVCHNIDGFRAVGKSIKIEYPDIKKIKMVIGISKSKVLEEIVDFIEKEENFKDVHIISRPHMRLYKAEDAFKAMSAVGCTKLRDVIFEDQLPNTEPDSDTSFSTDPGMLSNIKATLDHVLNEVGEDKNTLVLICGSFFIMSDVKKYFGQHMENDEVF